jgi:hypothetical protein
VKNIVFRATSYRPPEEMLLVFFREEWRFRRLESVVISGYPPDDDTRFVSMLGEKTEHRHLCERLEVLGPGQARVRLRRAVAVD